jgi:hypothetical protein
VPVATGNEKKSTAGESACPTTFASACVAMWGRRFRLPCVPEQVIISQSRQLRGFQVFKQPDCNAFVTAL